MRCRRCHTKLAPGKKTCPVCGTLVRKRRGSVKLATTAGGSVFDNLLAGVDMRKVLLGIFAAAAVGAVIYMFSAGCFSCGSCFACSSCASCSSCESCASCDSCGSCSSCGSRKKNGSVNLNSSKACNMCYYGDTLYYVSGESLVALKDDGSSEVIASGEKLSNICADDTYVYYRSGTGIWKTPKEKPMTVGDDPYVSVRVIDTVVSSSDVGVMSIYGFGVFGSDIAYWGPDSSGVFNIRTCGTDGSLGDLLYSGALTNVQTYGDCVYFTSRKEEDSGVVYRVTVPAGELSAATQFPLSYYAVSGGTIYGCRKVDETDELVRINNETGEPLQRWDLGKIDGLFANDEWIYYYINNMPEGGDIIRIRPGGSEAEPVFFDDSIIMMTGLAGNCFSVYTDIGATVDDRYDNAVHYIFNNDTHEQVACDK